MDLFINIIQDIIFSAIAAIGFASISNTPPSAMRYCALLAAIGHCIRFLLMGELNVHIIVASTLAAIIIGSLAIIFAPRAKCPPETFSFPALLPMIPGMYAYRADVLAEITRLPQSPLELAESLEQLRWLENGYKIKVGITDIETIGIDTPEDLDRAVEALRKRL